ncbi:MAG: hypothetical protein Fur0032_10010 [Terrimicrobiaceae bacterium]
MKKTILSIIGVAALAAGANAQVIYEGFAYTPGTNNLNGQNGGSGFSAAWSDASVTDNLSISSGSLVPTATMRTGYATTGNKTASPTGGGSNVDFIGTRQMSTSINLDSTSTTYFSFLVLGDWTTLGSSRGFNVGFTGSATSLSTNAITIKKDFNTQTLFSAVGGNHTGTGVSNAITDNTVTFVVGKLVTTNSGNDQLSFISYAGAETVANTETWDISNVSLGSLTGSLTHFVFSGRVNDNSMFYQFDEFRTGATWDAVTIPEPTTWALLAGSLTALVVFRRRRRA